MQFNDPVRIAVARVFEMRKNNSEWSFSFIVNKVADWHKVSFNVIMGRVLEMNKRSKWKQRTNGNRKPKNTNDAIRGKDGYPVDTPWWVKKG